MKWEKVDDYCLRSSDGRYTVAKIGGRDGVAYEVWRTRRHPDGAHLVAHNILDSVTARKLAEDDSRE